MMEDDQMVELMGEMTDKVEAIAIAIDRNTAEQRGSREELVEIVIAIQALTRTLKEK